jgi:PPOX class probable F420-dependent enzyme
MAGRPRAADSIDQHEAADGGYFAPLAPARYTRLTTFSRDGMPVSACVHGVVDGDRGYFNAWSRSGTVKRLRHTDAVLVTACGVLGWCSYGRPLGAIARQLQGEEASQVAANLDR